MAKEKPDIPFRSDATTLTPKRVGKVIVIPRSSFVLEHETDLYWTFRPMTREERASFLDKVGKDAAGA